MVECASKVQGLDSVNMIDVNFDQTAEQSKDSMSYFFYVNHL